VAQLIRTRRLTPQGGIISLQPKLTVGAADDPHEQEADRVARQIMSIPEASSVISTRTAIARAALPEGLPEKKTAEEDIPEEEEVKSVQASPAGSLANSFEAGEDVESRLNRSKGGGSPLPDAVRTFMEPRFGMDFSQVRAHTGSDAIQMNRDVGAKAFTHGADIYYGADSSPDNLELTAHELTHVVQQTGGAPLQPKRIAETAPANPHPSVQRACPACSADKEKKESDAGISRITRSGNTAQRSPVRERTHGPIIQGAWTLKETVRNSSPVIGDSTRGNGSTIALPLPTGVYGKTKAWQEAGFWQIYGGNAQLTMRRDTRYTFVHTGTDNNLLTLRGGASIFGGAEADDHHYGQAGAAVAGNVAVRTIANPAPGQKSLFPPIHDGGRSEAETSTIGEVDVSLPVGDATVDVKIPLTKTDEGELATLSESMPLHWDEPGGGEWKSVDVYLVAYIELAADIENEFWGTDGDVNWGQATAQYNLSWEERPIPAPPASGNGIAAIPTCGEKKTSTPQGTIEPKKGKYKDQKVTYHHRTGKHTKVAECPVSELVTATTIDPTQLPSELGRFVQACNAKDRSYGSQLGKEGYDDYGKLMLEAVENGNPDAGYRTTAPGDIGLHLGGKGCAASKTYEVMDDVPNDPKAQFHLYPVS
jgi:hypothetical protein